LNLQKAFENRRDSLWPAFKVGELALAGIQNRRVGSGRLSKSARWLCRFSKALGAALNLLSNRSKGFELADFKKLFANSKAFRGKCPKLKKIMNICQTLS
jgi:hypothetical protein